MPKGIDKAKKISKLWEQREKRMLPLGSRVESVLDRMRCHLVDEVVYKQKRNEDISGTRGHRVDGASDWLSPRQTANQAFVPLRLSGFRDPGTQSE